MAKQDEKTIAFSVAMCVYGKDDPVWFTTALESIQNQTRRPDEIVLVVDGPVPAALDEIIRVCEENPLFSVLRLEKNQGHGRARELSLQSCTKDWIALMDADDISCPDRFEKQLSYIGDHPECDIVGGNITEFRGTPDQIVGQRVVPQVGEAIRNYARRRCPMNQVTVLFRKAAVEAAGGYIDWFCEEDYYLWLRMLEKHMVFANLPDILVNVRVGEDMYQRRGGWQYFASEYRLQNYMRERGMIGWPRWGMNVAQRFILQVVMPNRLRGLVFKCFARKKYEEATEN